LVNLFKNIGSWCLIIIGFGSIILSGCKNDTEVGMELLPSTDLVNVKSSIIKNSIKAYTYTEDTVRTDESSKSLLGSFNDSIFGNTTINFAAQFRLTDYPDYGTNPIVDSVRLYLYYRLFYGDTSTIQNIKVYELNQPLDVDASYYHFTDFKTYAKPNPLTSYSFKPKIQQDSVSLDTAYQLLRIDLGKELGQKLAYADSLDMVDNEVFLNYFKGLYIESQNTDGRGGIISLETIANDSINGSAVVVFYRNNETDTTSLNNAYYISKFSARVNSFKHDYSRTTFFKNLNKETTQDSLLYIQPTGGLKSKIYIDDLLSWKDSSKITINKAEMVFQVDTVASDLRKYAPPYYLLLTFLDDKGGNYLPVDYAFSSSYYGGFLRSDYTYHFNITQLFEQIIKGTVINKGFYLTTLFRNSEANRIVLKGSKSATGIKFNITYTKINR
jgi:hypothetical protein